MPTASHEVLIEFAFARRAQISFVSLAFRMVRRPSFEGLRSASCSLVLISFISRLPKCFLQLLGGIGLPQLLSRLQSTLLVPTLWPWSVNDQRALAVQVIVVSWPSSWLCFVCPTRAR